MDSMKVSRRDIAYALNKASSSTRSGVVGGTTVAATMYLANMANIEVFATGGIGGVHRGADKSFDISADLIELASTPVTVVCAGVKSILDIPKTVEFMETHSVNCIVYGPRNSFPGFFTRETTMRGQFNTEDLAEVAEVIEKSKELGLCAGTVLACPIPKEFQGDGNVIEEAVQMALREAKEKGIQSKDVTPFILAYVNKMTSGASMKTNIALLKNNAKIGGQLASLLAKSKRSSRIRAKSHAEQYSKPVVVGATIVDFEYVTAEDVQKYRKFFEFYEADVTLSEMFSQIGTMEHHMWVESHNAVVELVEIMPMLSQELFALTLFRLGCDVSFVSTIGNDENGKYFLDQCSHIDHSRVEVVKDMPTAVYMSVNVRGEVRFGISSIGEIVNRITPEVILRNEDVISRADFVLFDANIPTNTIGKIVDLTSFYKTKAWFEPTDLFKARKIFDCEGIDRIQFTSPNANEFLQLVERSGLRKERRWMN
ncbi:indigoidine synthase A-like protein [Ancylostoma caninum]|uniref:Indigoidine synthase A-like protein n=1 Tax=Ancylostoma caninum TaxID=29170 RepID=A0A368GUY4_ANCCA|nr:indigoidine synthase A-like protein [Ancylostoma caninum]